MVNMFKCLCYWKLFVVKNIDEWTSQRSIIIQYEGAIYFIAVVVCVVNDVLRECYRSKINFHFGLRELYCKIPQPVACKMTYRFFTNKGRGIDIKSFVRSFRKRNNGKLQTDRRRKQKKTRAGRFEEWKKKLTLHEKNCVSSPRQLHSPTVGRWRWVKENFYLPLVEEMTDTIKRRRPGSY